jgi:vacuolar protein sorting-associated protein VTA1
MQTTKQFGEMSEDIEEKLQYAKWRAAEISKSIKTGQPPPPPPGQEEEEPQEEDFHPISQKEHVDEAFSKPILEKKPSSQFNDPFFNQPTQVQKPVEKNFNDFFDSVKPSAGKNDNAFNDDFFSSVQPGNQNSFGETKSTSNQPSMKTNNQPPAPNQPPKSTQPSVNNQPPAPKPSTNQPVNQSKQPSLDDKKKELDDFFSGFKTPNNQFTEQSKNEKNFPPPTNQNKPSTPSSSNNSQKATPNVVKPTVEAPKSQSAVKTEFVLQRHNVANPDATMEEILQAQKFAKFAVSSLQFPDVATAVKYLEDALAILVKK